jgi:hypothetical protein
LEVRDGRRAGFHDELAHRGASGRRFDIDVTRDGGWWTVHIREINGPAQGRTISEAESTAGR